MTKLTGAIGLMSGTSLDGIDVAFIQTDGDRKVHRGPSRTYPYDDDQRAMLRQALVDARRLTERQARPGSLAAVERAITDWHALAIDAFREEFGITPSEIDIIGFHGQTVIHRPERRLTVQLGDGALLARRVGRPVVHDMRAADIAAGGQGAPLVPVYHRALAASLAERPVAFVNIGGVANVTWIGEDGELLAFDTGPGNALLDDWALRHTGRARDENGALAFKGRIDEAALAQFLGDPFFEEPPPKSLDRNSFASLDLSRLSPSDGATTLAEFTARSIAGSQSWFPRTPARWVICGGGRHNRAIMGRLRSNLANVSACEELGFNGDAMEAEAWAYLAVRSRLGLPISFPGTTGVSQALTGGRLSEA